MYIPLKMALLVTSVAVSGMATPPAVAAVPTAPRFPSAAKVNHSMARSDDYRGTTVSRMAGCFPLISEPGKPMPFPDSPEGLRQLDICVRANVTNCRGQCKNNFDATRFVLAEMNVEVAIEGPKGVNPWE